MRTYCFVNKEFWIFELYTFKHNNNVQQNVYMISGWKDFVVLFKSMDRPLHMDFSELKTLTCECYLMDKKYILVYSSSCKLRTSLAFSDPRKYFLPS